MRAGRSQTENGARVGVSPFYPNPGVVFTQRNLTAGSTGEREAHENPWINSGSPFLWTQDLPEHGLKTALLFLISAPDTKALNVYERERVKSDSLSMM